MKNALPRSQSAVTWLLVIPTIAWFYVGLFVTIFIWYPTGLDRPALLAHVLNFSLMYLFWIGIFFSYRLFDWDVLQTSRSFVARLLAAIGVCLILAIVYFYLQPSLLLTPRRFLLVHMIISGAGILVWYLLMRQASARRPRRAVYAHPAVSNLEELQSLIEQNQFRGLKYSGVLAEVVEARESIVVIPAHADIGSEDGQELFRLRSQGVRFVEYSELYENLTRSIHLSVLSELWFLRSVDYGSHALFDLVKRAIDIFLGLLSTIIFLVTFPILAVLIKLTSKGPVLFTQKRVGQNGREFTLYKYRTMVSVSSLNSGDTWTEANDSRITGLGKILRLMRFDELPQSLNILNGDMSIVGPRPEQANIVAKLREQIPYYDERHIVKPGLTGWAQLHVYAGSLEETKRKLQYDLYYIKNRSLLFDAEIIIKTIYNIVTLAGR